MRTSAGMRTPSVGVALRDAEDAMVDFANASLYLTAMQTITAVVCTAVVSVLACWLVPEGGVSAVRTLALCAATGALLMRKPLRVGRAHGVAVVFSALQPALPLYLLALVVEQLVHTCSVETTSVPSWRRVVFHGMILTMTASGMMTAREPLGQKDVPFLITALALMVVALLPPPAQALVGPLCQSVSLWEASDRLVRSFAFATLYCAHIYAGTASSGLDTAGTWVVVARSAAASIWTMGAHIAWLPVAVAQCALVVLSRLRLENTESPQQGYRSLSPRDRASGEPPLAPSALSDDDGASEAAAATATASGEGADFLHHVVVAVESDPLEEQRRLLADTPHAVPTPALGGGASAVVVPPARGGFFRNTLPLGAAAIAAAARDDSPSPPPPLPAAAAAAAEEALAPAEPATAAEGATPAALGGPLQFRELPATLVDGEAEGSEEALAPPASAAAPLMRASDMTDARMAQIVSGLE